MTMKPVTIIFTLDEPKKHSIRYNGVTDSGAPVSFYVPRDAIPTPAPQRIQVTIQPLEH